MSQSPPLPCNASNISGASTVVGEEGDRDQDEPANLEPAAPEEAQEPNQFVATAAETWRSNYPDFPEEYAEAVQAILVAYSMRLHAIGAWRTAELEGLRLVITELLVRGANPAEHPHPQRPSLSETWAGLRALLHGDDLAFARRYGRVGGWVVGWWQACVLLPFLVAARLPDLVRLVPWCWMLTTRAAMCYLWRRSELAAQGRMLREMAVGRGGIPRGEADRIVTRMERLYNKTPEAFWTVKFLFQTISTWVWNC